jgi:hypothetical protein
LENRAGKQNMKYTKYMLYILLTLMIPVSAFAQLFQAHKTVACGPTEFLMEGIKEHGELKLSFLGNVATADQDDVIIVTLHQNEETGTFSVIESSINGISCMISLGTLKPKKNETEIEPKDVPEVIPDKNGATKTLWQKEKGWGIAIKF